MRTGISGFILKMWRICEHLTVVKDNGFTENAIRLFTIWQFEEQIGRKGCTKSKKRI